MFGPESSGKTTLTLHVVAEAQKTGGVAAFIDAEHALDVTYARKLGVNTDELLISQPDTGEQALEIAEILVRSNAVDVLVIDSVAALVAQGRDRRRNGRRPRRPQARLMSQALRKLTAVHFQVPDRRDLHQPDPPCASVVMFGNPETTTAANALKFYATQRLNIRRIAPSRSARTWSATGPGSRWSRTRSLPPFKEAEFDILYGRAFPRKRPDRHGRGGRHRGKERLVVLLRRGAHRPGRETPGPSWKRTRKSRAEIEKKLRGASALMKPE